MVEISIEDCKSNETPEQRRARVAEVLALPDLTEDERHYVEDWIASDSGLFVFRCKVVGIGKW